MNFVAIDRDEPKTSRESQWIVIVAKADIKDIISEKIFKLATKLKLLCLQRKQKRSWKMRLSNGTVRDRITSMAYSPGSQVCANRCRSMVPPVCRQGHLLHIGGRCAP